MLDCWAHVRHLNGLGWAGTSCGLLPHPTWQPLPAPWRPPAYPEFRTAPRPSRSRSPNRRDSGSAPTTPQDTLTLRAYTVVVVQVAPGAEGELTWKAAYSVGKEGWSIMPRISLSVFTL